MKPVNIVLLILAGALGGAVLTRVAQRPQARALLVARAPVNPPPPVAPAVNKPLIEAVTDIAAPARTAGATTPPARSQVTSQPRSVPAQRTSEAASHDEPVLVAQNQAPPAAPDAPAPAAPDPLPLAPAEPENATPLPPPPPAPNRVTLNAGMLIPVRLLDRLSTERCAPGDAFSATLDQELVAGDFVIAERGARAEGRVISVERGDKVHGGATLVIELTKLRTSDDQVVSIVTDAFTKRSEQDRSADAGKVVGGAAIGAIIGAIAGGGKGAAIGAGAGGGAGAGDVLLTRRPAALPSETRISFRLHDPVTVTEQARR